MAFPAGGVEAAYRNKIDHVAAVLRKSHDSNFLIYNLSNRGYNSSIFDGHVLDYGFPDHHPPPLHLLFEIIYSIHDWLTKNPLNIAVIHCLVLISLILSLKQIAYRNIHYFIKKRQEKEERA